MKFVKISHCSQCPHQDKSYAWCDDGYESVTGAVCELTNKPLDYKHYTSMLLKPHVAFPEDCPLPEVSDAE